MSSSRYAEEAVIIGRLFPPNIVELLNKIQHLAYHGSNHRYSLYTKDRRNETLIPGTAVNDQGWGKRFVFCSLTPGPGVGYLRLAHGRSFLLEEHQGTSRRFFVPPSCRPEPTASLFIMHSPKLGGDIGTDLIASFTIRVVSLLGGRKTLYYKDHNGRKM